MPETPGRFVSGTMAPALNSYSLLYLVPSATRMIYGIDVCNASGEDAHIRIYVVPAAAWGGGPTSEPTMGIRVVYNQRIEADATDGNVWVMPIKHLNPDDQVVVWTSKLGVTFYGHGFSYT